MENYKNQKGASLLEVITTVLIFSILIVLGLSSVRYFGSLLRQNKSSDLYRESQEVLYNVTKDIRNSAAIIFISSDTLILNAFNFRQGFSNPSLFDPTTFGTITYQYTLKSLKCRTEFPTTASSLAVDTTYYFLKGNVIEPSETTPLFSPYPPTSFAPYQGVTTALQVASTFNIEFSTFTANTLTRGRIR